MKTINTNINKKHNNQPIAIHAEAIKPAELILDIKQEQDKQIL